MPKLETLTLVTDQEPALTYPFVPSSNRNNRGILVDTTTETRLSNQQVIVAEVTPASSSAGKSRFRGSLKFPIPVEESSGCCPDLDNPPAIYSNVDIQASMAASSEQIANSLALFRAWVASDDFASLYAGQAYY